MTDPSWWHVFFALVAGTTFGFVICAMMVVGEKADRPFTGDQGIER